MTGNFNFIRKDKEMETKWEVPEQCIRDLGDLSVDGKYRFYMNENLVLDGILESVQEEGVFITETTGFGDTLCFEKEDFVAAEPLS